MPTRQRKVLPWELNTGWLLCDIYFTNGKPVPFSTRQVFRDALARLAAAGFDFVAGLEVEFHLFRLENPRLSPEDATWPPRAPEVSLLNQGYQYLTESRFDQIDAALEPIRRGVAALGMPLRSLEIELGPSQCEFTFRPQSGLATADTMILFRAATKQIARRHGYLASFMCRPALPNIFSSGWHLHQSLIERKRGTNAFAGDERDGLSMIGFRYLGGLLAHANAAAAFTTPTVNGYKRYRPYTLAPDRAIWARDNRGVMLRVLGQPGDAATHLETGSASPRPILISIWLRRFTPDSMASHGISTPDPRRIRLTKPRLRRCQKISAKLWPRCARARSLGRISALTPASKRPSWRALPPKTPRRPSRLR